MLVGGEEEAHDLLWVYSGPQAQECAASGEDHTRARAHPRILLVGQYLRQRATSPEAQHAVSAAIHYAVGHVTSPGSAQVSAFGYVRHTMSCGRAPHTSSARRS